MPVEIKETLEDIKACLINECRREPEVERAGYINGVLDFYNAILKQRQIDERI
jgi:hypothetical protein